MVKKCFWNCVYINSKAKIVSNRFSMSVPDVCIYISVFIIASFTVNIHTIPKTFFYHLYFTIQRGPVFTHWALYGKVYNMLLVFTGIDVSLTYTVHSRTYCNGSPSETGCLTCLTWSLTGACWLHTCWVNIW
jgi:hypothetical protein